MFARALGDGAELRPLEPWQVEEFFAHMERGRAHIGQHVGFTDLVTDLESARAWLQAYADRAAADTGRLYGIWLDGQLVGGVLLRLFDAAAGTCEAGCWLEPAATGRGLVTRAVKLMIDWAVYERGVHRVEWLVAPANTPSINVAKRLGMRHEGTLREGYLRRGERYDTQVWSVLAPEWKAARGRS